MRHAREAHVPTNAVHQRWMLDHILASIYPGKADAWKPGVLARVDYERTRAVMIGAGPDRVGALLRALRRRRAPAVLRSLPIAWRLTLLVAARRGHRAGRRERRLVHVGPRPPGEAEAGRVRRRHGRHRQPHRHRGPLGREDHRGPRRARSTTSSRGPTGRARCCGGRCRTTTSSTPPASATSRRSTATSRPTPTTRPASTGHAGQGRRPARTRWSSPTSASDGRAYDVGDWYQLPFQTRHAVWTEPYYQEGGGDVVLATYAVPVHLRDDQAPVSAVVTGDVSLFWLAAAAAEHRRGRRRVRVPDQQERHVHRPPGPRLHHERVHLQRGRRAPRRAAARHRPEDDRRRAPATSCSTACAP